MMYLLLQRACGRVGLPYPSPACDASQPAQEEASGRIALYNLAQQASEGRVMGRVGAANQLVLPKLLVTLWVRAGVPRDPPTSHCTSHER